MSMSDEVEYRAYVVGLDEHYTGVPHSFIAANDDAALEHARQFVDGHDIELWSGARFVVKLRASK
jgi:hypothetical protein